MIFHYLKTIFRNLSKQKVNSAINIFGLSLGLAISLLIWIFVLHELSYDRFLDDHENIYRIDSTAELGQGGPQTLPAVMFPIAEQAHNDFPEVENFVRFTTYYSSPEVNFDDKIITLPGIIFADSTFFSVFSFNFIAGDPSTALKQTTSIVLTQTSASRLFEEPEMAVNKVITIQGESYQVTGVIEDLPDNTHMDFNAVSRQENLPDMMKVSGMNFRAYLKLTPGANINEVEKKLDKVVKDHIAGNPIYEGFDFKVANKLINVADIHLHSNLVWEMKPNGSYRNVIIFSLLAIFILFIAIINYVNLATARSTLRSKEIGMRKVVGASRGRLMRQILLESGILTIVSFLIAFAMAEIFSGVFSQVLGISFNTTLLMTGKGLLAIFIILLITGIFSGLYPAFYMASFDPVRILKGEVVKGTKGRVLRRSLVVFQFSITIFILSSLIVITRQLEYMQTRNLGFDKEQIVLVRNLSNTLRRSSSSLKAELESLSQVEGVAGANFIYGGSNRIDLITELGVAKESGVTADIISVDENFLDVMGIEVIQGRNFLSGSETDLQGGFILNKTAVDALGFDEPINKQLDLFNRQGPLVGLVNDFHLKSLHQPVGPLVLIFSQEAFTNIYLRVAPGNVTQLQQDINEIFYKFDPSHVPDIVFLDQRIQNLYQQEQNQATLLSTGALLAIIISVLGVYGLASFSAQRRIKEIGIRKVLGATTASLLWVFNKESILLVTIAFFIAAPMSWVIMDGWLDNFAARVSLNPLWFILPGILTFLFSSAIISLQAWLTSRANPATSLRSE